MGIYCKPISCGDLATCSLADLGTADAGDITSGTFNADRIPILPTDRYGSAVLVDGSRAMAGTLNIGNHLIDDVSKIGFRDIHDVALITEGTYSISAVNKAESVWGNIECGYSYVHAGFAWYIEDKVAGEDLEGAHLVFLKSDSKWWKTDADVEATTKGMLGLVMQTKSAGQTVRVLLFGRASFTGWGLTVGATQYVSCAKGLITETAPSGSGDQVRKIGHALSSTTIIFNPDATILEIT